MGLETVTPGEVATSDSCAIANPVIIVSEVSASRMLWRIPAEPWPIWHPQCHGQLLALSSHAS